MHLKPRAWFLISLLLFAAAICTWQYAEKKSAERNASAAAARASSALKMQHPPLVKALATNTVAQRKSYRISNTSQTIQQLLHNNHALILRNALIDTEVPVGLNIPANLRAKGAPGSYLVQADRPLDKDFYAELQRAGATYVSYVPNNAALVAASPQQATNLAANMDVVAVLPYEPYYKLDSTLLPSAVDQQPQTNALSVTTFPGQRDAALTALTQLGATLIGEDRSPFGPTLVVNVPSGSLAAVAQLPLAQEIEVYTPRRIMNDLTRVIMGVATNTLIGTTNYLGLTGLNVTVNMNDSGVDGGHPDLTNRVLGDVIDTDGHGTHVAGIIAGSGAKSTSVTNYIPGSITTNGASGHADFRGKATNATLFVQSLDLVTGPFVSDSFLQENASTNLGTTNLISNNSWAYGSTVYDTAAASYDAATRDAQPNIDGEQPLLFVFAAGNGGGGNDSGTAGFAGSVNSPGTAKNVITVGSTDSPRFITNLVTEDDMTTNQVWYGETDNSNLVSYFSGCGNVSIGVEGTYGRFKPDVVAPGTFIISCRAADYVDPTNETLVTDYSYTNTVPLHQTNYYPFILPTDISQLTIIISSNAASPTPFPTNMQLLADAFEYPPTDIVSSDNFYQLTMTNFAPGDVWFFGVTPPTNSPGPVEYTINFYLYETNDLGDYFEVLSNLNSSLQPYYRFESGTSMSAGAISGTLALMQEFLQTKVGITNPSPALLKAMLINGTRSLGAPYNLSVNTLGANEEGWGLPNLTNILSSSLTNGSGATNLSMLLIDQSPANALATGQYETYSITCSDTNAAQLYPMRFTLVWTDPPGDPAAGVALVNNLNLTVADATGTNVYIGNDFLGTSFTTDSSPTNLPPGESDNDVQNIYVNSLGTPVFTAAGDAINNVQNVFINSASVPIKFPLTVTISGTRVNVNAVPGQTNNILQDYALVVSSDDPALTSSLLITTNPVLSTAPVLVTVASNGVPLLHQRVGANEPNLYSYPGSTNGNFSQWHFFVFTNTQFSATNQATNVAFATFLPPELSIPRNSGADIDLYVSTDPGLTNLTPSVVQAADKSLSRTGTESIVYSNSFANEVYYIGVKSEDQQAADFGFYGIAQQNPFSSANSDGSIVATGTGLPAFIPNSLSATPALVFAFVINPNPLEQYIRRVTVNLGLEFPTPGSLYGSLQHDGLTTVLNDFSGYEYGITNTYDDLDENPSSGDVPTDGPGSLKQYVGQQMNGLWLLAEANDDQSLTGEVTRYTVTVDPQPLLSGFFITLGAQQWFDDYLLVPNDATNLIISALYENDGTNAAGSGPIGIYLTNFDDLNLSDYGVSNISPPGGFLSLGTNDPVPGWPGSPPLSGGVWYFGIYNAGTASATLFVQVQVQESLTPNLVQYYTNSGVPVPLTTDAHTQTQICINNSQQLVSLQVGVRINDTNLDDLVLHLISPEGTSVLLFENRGGTGATNLGLTLTNNSAIYTIFTENTNLTTTPIKFAVPPFAQTIIVPQATLWSNSFETVTNGVYTNGALLEGWLVTNDVVSIEDTNGTEFVTNDEVGIVADPNGDQFINDGVTNSLGSNYLALTSGHIMQTFGTTNAPFTSAAGFAITNGQPYELVFYAKPLGITHWWPADDNADDIIGGDNGTIPDTNNVTFDVGEVDRAFTFSGMPNNLNSNNNEVDFGTNVGNIGTNDFTVDFWIKQPPTATNLYGILEKRPECNANLSAWYIRVGPGAGFSAPPGDMTMVVNDNAGANLGVLIANQPINDGNFHHAAFTRNGLVLSIYIDGVLNTNLTNAGIANLSNSVMFRAGQSVCVPPSYGDLSDGSVPFVGSLDELDLYDRALSPAEIYAIYHAGSLGKYSTNSLLPNFDLTIDGISTNNIVLTNASGGWQLFTNSFVANSDQVTVEFQGNALGVLLDGIQLIQLPTTNYNNYYLPEEPLTPFVGENPQGCWTLDIWDTRNDSSQPTDGTLLGWTLEVTTSSTNAVLTVLTNDLPVTNVVPTNSISYFAVDVPSYVTFATNILTVISGGPLTLFFDQTALPTGGQPGDVTLTNGVVVANSPSTTVLSTEGAPPPLLPGQRYFLGVQNNSTSNATFSIEVDFNGLTGLITPLTNGIAYSNVIGTNAIGTNGPQYYSFVVPTNAVSATFQILNPSDGEVDLYARDGLPLPGPSSFDYESQNAGSNDQFIVVTTNSVPVPLPLVSTNDVVPLQPSVWYLAAYNFAATNNIGYTIVATWVTTNQIASEIIPLTNGIPYTNTAIPGYTNVLYSFTVTNSPAGVQFTVTNLTNSGNVELLADLDIYPTPQEFYSGSFNAGTAPQLVQIGTNSTLPNLNGVWYLSVPNTSVSNVLYTIEATNLLVGPVTGLPLIVKGSISAQAGHFTMTWAAVSGKTYEIQDSTNLVTWTVLTNITAQSATGTYTDPTPIAGEKARYYRLLLVTTQSLNLNGSITSPARDFKLTWTATPGENYEVDMSTNLVTWTLLTNITVQSGTGSFTDTSPVTGHTARFYRVLPP